MKRFLFLGCWICVVAAANAAPTSVTTSKEVTYTIPNGSPVGYERTGEYDTVYYSGRFNLTGTYEYGYVTDNPQDDTSYGELFLSFRISQTAAAKLPYWKRDRPITYIEIRNPKQFVHAVIGAGNLGRLQRHEIKKVSGTVNVVVSGFQTTVECDHQISSAEFVSVARVRQRTLAMLLASEPGC